MNLQDEPRILLHEVGDFKDYFKPIKTYRTRGKNVVSSETTPIQDIKISG